MALVQFAVGGPIPALGRVHLLGTRILSRKYSPERHMILFFPYLYGYGGLQVTGNFVVRTLRGPELGVLWRMFLSKVKVVALSVASLNLCNLRCSGTAGQNTCD